MLLNACCVPSALTGLAIGAHRKRPDPPGDTATGLWQIDLSSLNRDVECPSVGTIFAHSLRHSHLDTWRAGTGRRPGLRLSPRAYFQRAFAAVLAISFRRLADIPSARAFPPLRPSATAAGSLPSSGVLRMTWTVLPITLAGRRSPLGPRGIFFTPCALLSAKHIINRGQKRGCVMSIVPLLQEAAFDPEATHILTTAFNKAWDKFKSSAARSRMMLARLRRERSSPSKLLIQPERARETLIA